MQNTNKYQNGKIYKITDNAYTEQYIGSTIQPLSNKMSGYRRNYEYFKEGRYNYVTVFDLFDKYGVENCKIELVERFPCTDREDLMKREGMCIKTEECVNKRIAGRSDLEYYNDNREKLLEYSKGYRDRERSKLKEKQKEHYDKNKAKVLDRQKKYRDEHKEQIRTYMKQYQQENKEKLTEKNKQYRDENKEKIKESREQRKEEMNAYKREKVECEHCKIIISRNSMSRHIKRTHPETTQ